MSLQRVQTNTVGVVEIAAVGAEAQGLGWRQPVREGFAEPGQIRGLPEIGGDLK